jgi:hypothetical protein
VQGNPYSSLSFLCLLGRCWCFRHLRRLGRLWRGVQCRDILLLLRLFLCLLGCFRCLLHRFGLLWLIFLLFFFATLLAVSGGTGTGGTPGPNGMRVPVAWMGKFLATVESATDCAASTGAVEVEATGGAVDGNWAWMYGCVILIIGTKGWGSLS